MSTCMTVLAPTLLSPISSLFVPPCKATYWPEFLTVGYVYTGVGRGPVFGEGNYRCDMQGRVQHVRRATGAPDDLPRLQKQLLMRDFDILAPGGSLIYATCTYNLAENEAVVQGLLSNARLPHSRLRFRCPIALACCNGGDTYDARMQHCWRLYPHQTGSVGLFVASMRA